MDQVYDGGSCGEECRPCARYTTDTSHIWPINSWWYTQWPAAWRRMWLYLRQVPVTQLTSSPANVEAATLFKENLKEYERKVKVSILCRCELFVRARWLSMVEGSCKNGDR